MRKVAQVGSTPYLALPQTCASGVMKNNFFIYGIMFLVLLIMWASCGRIAGTYVANHGIGTDTLKVFSNHKYIRLCYPPRDTKHYCDSGTWAVSDGRINFWNWHLRNIEIEYSSSEQSVIWGTVLDRSFFIGKVQFPINLDMGYYYIKQ